MNYWWVRTRSNGSGPAASAPVILKKAVSLLAGPCGSVGWHWDPQDGYPT
jgi:hypothetical protein